MERLTGIIKNIPEGKTFGFIYVPGRLEFFFHAGELKESAIAFADLEHGDVVEFTPEFGHPKGPRATDVHFIRKAGVDSRSHERIDDGKEDDDSRWNKEGAADTTAAGYGGPRGPRARGAGR